MPPARRGLRLARLLFRRTDDFRAEERSLNTARSTALTSPLPNCFGKAPSEGAHGPMRLELAEPRDPDVWDAQVRAAGGSVYHSNAWARFVVAHGGGNVEPRRLILRDRAAVARGVALAFRLRSRRRLLAPFTGLLWTEASPALVPGSEDLLPEFLRLLEAEALSGGDVEIRIGSYGSPDDAAGLRAAGFALTARREFELSLARSEEELWAGLASQRRRNVKKAQRLGVTVHELSADDGPATLLWLGAHSRFRIAQRGGGKLEYIGVEALGELVRSGVGRILAARLRDAWVSAVLCTTFNGLAYYTMAGHSGLGLDAQAATLVAWEAITRYRREGAARFSLGGCSFEATDPASPEHGVYQYKSAFGGAERTCTNGRKVLRPWLSGALERWRRFARR